MSETPHESPAPLRLLNSLRGTLVAELGPVTTAREASQRLKLLERPAGQSAASLLQQLREAGLCHDLRLDAGQYESLTRLALDDRFDLFDVGRSLRSAAAYFSHGSAVFLHGLTTDIPTLVYLNREQTPKPAPQGPIAQSAVDRAFSSSARRTALIYTCEAGQVAVLSGKHTENWEVGTVTTPSLRTVSATKLERTLVDIAVRPDYAGGVFKVREAYEEAVRRGISTNTLLATLRKLDHKYPYHQAIGAYLERAGASGAVIDRLRELPMELDFYLTHRIADKAFDARWRIYVPRGF